jgi:methionyl-tRNA synthetase
VENPSSTGATNQETSSQGKPLEAATTEVKPVEIVAAEEAQIDIEHFKKVQLRVGQVIAAEMVPKSKKLIKLQVDLGAKLGTRQILSGIAQFYAPEQLVGKKIIVVANLKKAMLMGLESHGMLLAASDESGTKLSIVDPGAEMELGSEVR